MTFYECGDLISLKNMKFLDNGMIDLKSHRRPFIVISKFDIMDDDCYLLKLSSSDKIYNGDKNSYYKLYPNKQNKLPKVSYVDLRDIYSTNSKSEKVKGYINDIELKKIINKLEAHQYLVCSKSYVLWKSDVRSELKFP